MVVISQFPPRLPSPPLPAPTNPKNGGRVQSITVNPLNNSIMIVANQCGGLWKTENGGMNWFHLDGLLSLFVRDVAYASDGITVIATVARDDQVRNGGGIWVSPDGGNSWSRPITGDPHTWVNPTTGDPLPNISRIPDRISAYGISYSPDDSNMVYVGTDYGVAISTDSGRTWFHQMLDGTTRVWDGRWLADGTVLTSRMQNAVISILALPNNKAIALSGTGVYRTVERYREGRPWTWSPILLDLQDHEGRGNFMFLWRLSCKNIDVSPLDSDKVFILKNYSTLVLYEVSDNQLMIIPLPSPARISRGPFVRVSRSRPPNNSSIDIWVGQGIILRKATCPNIDSVRRLTASDWIEVGSGLHVDSGYLALDNSKRPVLYGSDGGLFKPANVEATRWNGIDTGNTGTNSFQISDLAGTNVSLPSGLHTSLYFTTQDNAIWASADGGFTWPNSEGPEGCLLQVRKDASSDSEVTVAYVRVTPDPLQNQRFSGANLVNPRNIPNMDTTGRSLSDWWSAIFVSPDNWIRFRTAAPNMSEIYISSNDGSNLRWRKRAEVRLQPEGIFTVSGPSSNPVIYAPFKGTRTRPDGKEIIGLLKLTNMFNASDFSTMGSYDDQNADSFVYLPNNGSLGIRGTEFDFHAVYGVDPNNPDYIIAPDIYNNEVKVWSIHAGAVGGSWSTDRNLTKEVTKNGNLLFYETDEGRLQVTQISFDPYHPNRILIGTLDAGVILSEDFGKNWTTIPNSEKILFITNFFFKRNNTVLVASYGMGLWKIDFNVYPIPFPYEEYCLGDCFIRSLDDPEILTNPINWVDRDATIFLNGKINGLVLSGNEIKTITITPGSVFKRYAGKTKEYREANIVESEKGEGFSELKGCLAALQNDEVIKGVILEDNEIVGIISGKQEFKEAEKKPVAEGELSHEDDRVDEGRPEVSSKQPYLFITTSMPISGEPVIGNDGVISIFATGFKFDPNGKNDVMITIDALPIDQTAKVMEDGTALSELKVQANELSYGKHTIQIIQKLDGEELTGSGSFVKGAIDDFDENI